MTIFVNDTFSATGGVGDPPLILLNTHTAGETGHTWNCADALELRTDTQVVGSRSANNYDHVTASLAPPSADYSVRFDANVLSTVDFTACGPGARVSGANRDSGYFATVDPNAGELRLERFDAGSRTTLGTPYSISGLLGTLPATLADVEVKCEGDQISVLLGGSVVVSPVTDTTYTAAGLSGFYIRVGLVFDHITVDNFVATAATGPSLTVTQTELTPGGTISGSYSNYETVPTTLTVTDGTNTITIASPTINDNGDGTGTFSGTMPSLPTSGTADLVLFGDVTVELS